MTIILTIKRGLEAGTADSGEGGGERLEKWSGEKYGCFCPRISGGKIYFEIEVIYLY